MNTLLSNRFHYSSKIQLNITSLTFHASMIYIIQSRQRTPNWTAHCGMPFQELPGHGISSCHPKITIYNQEPICKTELTSRLLCSSPHLSKYLCLERTTHPKSQKHQGTPAQNCYRNRAIPAGAPPAALRGNAFLPGACASTATDKTTSPHTGIRTNRWWALQVGGAYRAAGAGAAAAHPPRGGELQGSGDAARRRHRPLW
jgi:hypothetical protein